MLGMSAMLTTPYRAKHPEVRFTILSRTSIQILSMIENLEVDAGLTYLDNEPLGRVKSVTLYQEEYRLLTSGSAPLGDRDQVTWAEVAKIPLCLLTPDMQNRRILDGLLRGAGSEPAPTLESNSVIVLFSHVRSGRWATIMPAKLAETLGLTDNVRSIPIIEPLVTHAVGLVVPDREPTTPLITALIAEARQLAKILEQPSAAAGNTKEIKPAGEKKRTAAKTKKTRAHNLMFLIVACVSREAIESLQRCIRTNGRVEQAPTQPALRAVPWATRPIQVPSALTKALGLVFW